ncbi:hypothetical protein L6452_03968 [Arctium lappa]|uniref:Uncharacterized protein n=1 Tax=Arctium lappa TaxID=4217 RepID=A0ACB9FPM5_ARCLA|nr:hypothetical protein L6452_03968 [Arctium lappa]
MGSRGISCFIPKIRVREREMAVRVPHSTLASGLYMKSNCKSFKIQLFSWMKNGCLSRRCWLVWTCALKGRFLVLYSSLEYGEGSSSLR